MHTSSPAQPSSWSTLRRAQPQNHAAPCAQTARTAGSCGPRAAGPPTAAAAERSAAGPPAARRSASRPAPRQRPAHGSRAGSGSTQQGASRHREGIAQGRQRRAAQRRAQRGTAQQSHTCARRFFLGSSTPSSVCFTRQSRVREKGCLSTRCCSPACTSETKPSRLSMQVRKSA